MIPANLIRTRTKAARRQIDETKYAQWVLYAETKVHAAADRGEYEAVVIMENATAVVMDQIAKDFRQAGYEAHAHGSTLKIRWFTDPDPDPRNPKPLPLP